MDTNLTPQFPEALTWPEKAKAIAITDQPSYDLAAGMKLDLTALRKKIVEEFAPMKEAAHKAHKAITSKEAEYLAPLVEAEGLLVAGLKRFMAEQERIRQEHQRAIEAEQRRLEEEDRKRRLELAKSAQEAERQRIAEIRAREEAERLANATTEADLETPVFEVPELPPVEAFIAPPTIAPAPIAAPTFERTKGLGIRTTWECRVLSVKELCRAVAEGKIPDTYVLPNMVALNGRARTDKRAMSIPGCVAVEK
ncbi:MAG: hypothetical protein EBR82_22525 [Caulobacteraceae bacterium]|nr:hypothetical protein [Caulobacteraceae bacterium]